LLLCVHSLNEVFAGIQGVHFPAMPLYEKFFVFSVPPEYQPPGYTLPFLFAQRSGRQQKHAVKPLKQFHMTRWILSPVLFLI
jgi:hypothetical protein